MARFNTDAFRSLNESIARVQNPQAALDEAMEYTSILESVILDLCEELELDPQALVEDVMTAGRERQLSGKINRQAYKTNKAYAADDNDESPVGDEKSKRRTAIEFRKQYERSKKLGKRYDHEMQSDKVFGKGGRVLRDKDGKPLSQRAAKRSGLKLKPKTQFYGSERVGSARQRRRGGNFQDSF